MKEIEVVIDTEEIAEFLWATNWKRVRSKTRRNWRSRRYYIWVFIREMHDWWSFWWRGWMKVTTGITRRFYSYKPVTNIVNNYWYNENFTQEVKECSKNYWFFIRKKNIVHIQVVIIVVEGARIQVAIINDVHLVMDINIIKET